MTKSNWLLIVMAVLITLFPLLYQKDAQFSGADDQLKDTISEVAPNYQPWFQFIWEPPSSEVESLLFAVQAGLGAGFLGYFFGYYQGRRHDP